MTDQERKAMEMALEALEWSWGGEPLGTKEFEAITALRQALAQPANQSDCGHTEYEPFCQMCMATKQKPEQEPDAYMTYKGYLYHASDPKVLEHSDPTPLYTAPPSKPWQSLTDEEIDYIWGITKADYEDKFAFPRAIEAALKERNT